MSKQKNRSCCGGYVLRGGYALVLGAGIATTGIITTPQDVSAETPEQRCQRETRQYNQTQASLWRATHPGQPVPDPAPWPPYVCIGGPSLDNPPPATAAPTTPAGAAVEPPSDSTSGGSLFTTAPAAPANPAPAARDVPTQAQASGVGLAPRPDRWGESTSPANTGGSENGQDIGTPRTHRGTGPGGIGVEDSGSSALDSARSNMIVPSRSVTVPSEDGAQKNVVTVGDHGSGVSAVLDDQSQATGDVLITDDTGEVRHEFRDTLRGVPADQIEQVIRNTGSGPSSTSSAVSSPVASPVVPSPPVEENQDVAQSVQSDESGVSLRSLIAAIAAVLAGAAAAVRRRGRAVTRGGGVSSPVSGVVDGAVSRLRGLSESAVDPGVLAREVGRGLPARDGSWQGDIDWGGGRRQSLIVVAGPDSPREYRYPLAVPEGGSVVENGDGSVDVVDAQGRVVEHVASPWAYDAAGRPVETYFVVDRDSGELVQVVDPGRESVLPILADPDRQQSVDRSGSVPKENGDLDKKAAAAAVGDYPPGKPLPPNTPRRKVTRIGGSRSEEARFHGAPPEIVEQEYLDETRPQRQPGFIGPVTQEDAAGQARNRARRGDFVSPEDASYTDYRFPGSVYQGSDTESVSVQRELDGARPERHPDYQGPVSAEDAAGQERNSARRELTDIQLGRFQDDQGRWHEGTESAAGSDTPVYRLDDGQVLYGRDNDEGTDWIVRNKEGEVSVVRELSWDENGDPVVGDKDDFVSREEYEKQGRVEELSSVEDVEAINRGEELPARGASGGDEGGDSGKAPREQEPDNTQKTQEDQQSGMDALKPSASDYALAAYDAGTSTPLEMADRSAQQDWEIADKTGSERQKARTAQNLDDTVRVTRGAGRVLGPAGVALGVGADVNSGMDPTKAVVTNSAGAVGGVAAGAGAVGVAALFGATAPVAVVVGAGVIGGIAATKASQALWDKVTK